MYTSYKSLKPYLNGERWWKLQMIAFVTIRFPVDLDIF